MNAIEFLRSKGVLDADHHEFKIKYPDGRIIELGALLEEYAGEFKSCLTELVRLKKIKDEVDQGISPGMDPYLDYKKNKPIAWDRAKQLVNS